MHTADGAPFTARLTHLAGNKLGKLDIGSEDQAQAAVDRIASKALSIQAITKKQVRRNPAAPFITSTLQMEASRKLGMSASNTMRNAQALYEAGLITYMRTDGTTLSGEAVAQARKIIGSEYGDKYLPIRRGCISPKPRTRKKRTRRSGRRICPSIRGAGAMKDEYQRKLYELYLEAHHGIADGKCGAGSSGGGY